VCHCLVGLHIVVGGLIVHAAACYGSSMIVLHIARRAKHLSRNNELAVNECVLRMVMKNEAFSLNISPPNDFNLEGMKRFSLPSSLRYLSLYLTCKTQPASQPMCEVASMSIIHDKRFVPW